MSAAAPWSVKGIDPKAREIAKDLARRSGMTLGEWLNSMILEDEEEGYATLPRRSHAAESYERRARSRRLDDAYPEERSWQRLNASVEALADRLEASERRTTVAVQSIDQAVAGLVRRLDEKDGSSLRRIEDISDELKEGHRRLRRFEQETGPKTTEQFAKVETSLGTIAGRLYDMEERQRTSFNDLRQRMDAVEKANPGAAETLGHVGARLDAAQAQTGDALRRLETAFAQLDQRLRAAEGRIEPEGAREASRFEKLAETLARQVESNRAEMLRRLETAEAEGRMERIERAVAAVSDQMKASEQRSAQAVEAMGRELLRMGQNLHGRMQKVETDGALQLGRLAQELTGRVDRDMARHAQAVEQRLIASDDRHALALEKLGVEITRISDRLGDRIAQSERKAAQAVEDIGRRLSESADRADQRYDRASGELAERMRQTEERTAALLAETRTLLERRAAEASAPRETPLAPPVEAPSALPASSPPPAPSVDWRAAAFREDFTAGEDFWSADPNDAAPFPGLASGGDAPLPARTAAAPSLNAPLVEDGFGDAYAPEPEAPAPVAPPVPPVQATPFGSTAGFGGADVSDALAATGAIGPGFQTPSDVDALDDPDAFAAETEFVDPRVLRAAAARGRAASTRQTIDAARAAMTAPADEEAPKRTGFGLKRGGKSRLQERMDKQAAREGSTMRKALGASAVAVTVVAGAYGYAEVTGQSLPIPGLDRSAPSAPEAGELTALAATTPTDRAAAEEAYVQAQAQFEGGDPEQAVTLLTQAAEAGHAQARLELAMLYKDGGAGVAADPIEARRWGRLAAEAGDPAGMQFYGLALYQGEGGAANRPEGLRWMLRAAERGLVDAQYNVARIYERGAEGVPVNLTSALQWYLIAARSGDGEAQTAVQRVRPQLSERALRAAEARAEAFTVAPLA